MTLTTRVETTVDAEVSVVGFLFRFGLEWVTGAPRVWLEILSDEPAMTPPSRWTVGSDDDALTAVRELRDALAEIERHLAPPVGSFTVPMGTFGAAAESGAITITTERAIETAPQSPVAPLAMPPEAIAALANRWALARAAVGGAVIPIDSPAA